MAGSMLVVCLFVACWIGFIQAQGDGPTSGCTLRLNSDLPKLNDPVLFTKDAKNYWTLAIPKMVSGDAAVTLRVGQEMLLSCPGPNNFLLVNRQTNAKVTCQQGNTVTLGNSNYPMSQLACNTSVTASLRDTKKACASGKGVLLEQGFEADGWHKLIESCHSKTQSHTYYSAHVIRGPAIFGKAYQEVRPEFMKGDNSLFAGFNPHGAYSRRNQENVLTRIGGARRAAEYMRPNDYTFIARGHLAPHADFLFGSWQMASYYYVNVAPQWQIINGGSWLEVEKDVRKAAGKKRVDLDVVTGTYGVMTVPDSSSKPVPYYLQTNNRLPVPDMFWKLLHNPQDNSCIAIISTNNPFLTSPPRTICPDVCAQNNWSTYQSQLTKGYVYCCDYQSFAKVVTTAPSFNCQSVLKFK